MTGVLHVTLLAPDIVETILDGNQRPEVTLAQVLGQSRRSGATNEFSSAEPRERPRSPAQSVPARGAGNSTPTQTATR